MIDAPDAQLLEQFVRNRSEDAFATLVQRHLALVHSVALRHTANPQHAEDITQAVFVILARKASTLGRRTVLAGWLYHTARLIAANLKRVEARRVRREQEVFMQSEIEASPAENLWCELSPQLDEAMAGLAAIERDALVLRYFQNKSMAEVGLSLGLAENAAQKRVSRALEKLRRFFAKRGTHSTATGIADTISTHSVQAASIELARSVTAVALAKGGTASASTSSLIKGALKIMAWTKTKTAVVGAALALFGIGATTFVAKDLLPAPGIQGTWEGTLLLGGSGVQAGDSPKTRLVMRIAEVNGQFQVNGDDIDRGSKDVPISKFTLRHRRIHAEVSGGQNSFDGTVNLAGTKISGTWTQGKDSGPLVFRRTANPPAFPDPLVDSEFAPRTGSDLQGLWKGMIGSGKGAVRIEIKIAEPPDGTFRADFYCPDQKADRQPASVSYDGATVKLMPMAGYGMFQGGLRNGDREMAGDWIQGGRHVPTTLARAN